MMKIDILTLFPEMFTGPFSASIIKRAEEKKLIEIEIHNLRTWTHDRHQTVDDKPFGGGPGMLLKPEPLFEAIEDLGKKSSTKAKVILLTPSGKTFTQKKAHTLGKQKHLIFICGHYEGIDQRVIDNLVDEEISIGDYVLTGGEIPTMVLVDSIVRLIPDVIEGEGSIENESFSFSDPQALEYPQYTRPAEFQGLKVPKILISGNHQEIAKWKKTHLRKKK